MLPDLYALVIELRPERGPLPELYGTQAQGLFFDMIRQIDPALSERLHADSASKPYTLAIRRNSPDTAQMRISLMHADLFATLTHALLQQMSRPTLRLGTTAVRMGDVAGTPELSPWAGFSSFAELATAARPERTLTLQFVTPTAVGKGSDAQGRARVWLLPTPDAMFGSLMRRWNELVTDPALRIDPALVEYAADTTLISQHRISTISVRRGEAEQKGFVGACTYLLPGDDEAAQTLTLLADAAFYLGIGMKTGRGHGMARRVLWSAEDDRT